MKKLIAILSLCLALCLAFGIALAEEPSGESNAHPVNPITGEYIHDYSVEADEEKVIFWPGKDGNGLIRFECSYAGEYEEEGTEGYLPAAQDFQEYVIFADNGGFPETVEEAMELVKAKSKQVKKYVEPNCKKGIEGYIEVYCNDYEDMLAAGKDYQKLEYDGVKFTGWKGICTETVRFELGLHKWSDDDLWADKREAEDKPQYHFIKEATCTEQGILRPYCLDCDTERGDEVKTDKKAHQYDWVVLVAPNCKTAGKEAYQCIWCGAPDRSPMAPKPAERVLPIDPSAHVFGDWLTESYKAPTCEEEGTKTEYRLCTLCLKAKEVNTTTLDALGHDFTKDIEVSTCVEHYTAKACSRGCKDEDGNPLIDEDTKKELDPDPTAHPLEYWHKLPDESEEATCTKDGKDVFECKLCGAKGETKLPKLGHIPDPEKGSEFVPGHCGKDKASEQADVTKYICKRCGEEYEVKGKVPEHDWTEWTCRNEYNQDGLNTPAYWIRQCLECGKHEEKVIDSDQNPNSNCLNGHTEVKLEAVAATCEKAGLTEGIKCSVCGEIIKAQEEIPATGHKFDDGVITKEATPEADGEKTFTCTVCGLVKTEVVPFEYAETPAYSLEGMSYGANKITGTAVHDASTVEAPKLYARVTVFFVGGTYAVFADYVEDGVIDIEVHGTVLAVSVELTGSKNIVPGAEMVVYDSWGEYYKD